MANHFEVNKMREDELIKGFTCICLGDVPFGHYPTVVKWYPTDTTAECIECEKIWDLEAIRYAKEMGGWD
jgi:hypothetical protein